MQHKNNTANTAQEANTLTETGVCAVSWNMELAAVDGADTAKNELSGATGPKAQNNTNAVKRAAWFPKVRRFIGLDFWFSVSGNRASLSEKRCAALSG